MPYLYKAYQYYTRIMPELNPSVRGSSPLVAGGEGIVNKTHHMFPFEAVYAIILA